MNTLIVPQKKVVFSLLREKFEKAVKARMMSDVPWGVLLSGGLDSSLVASIASRYFKSNNSWFSKLHSFTIGLPDSSDLIAARKVSEFFSVRFFKSILANRRLSVLKSGFMTCVCSLFLGKRLCYIHHD